MASLQAAVQRKQDFIGSSVCPVSSVLRFSLLPCKHDMRHHLLGSDTSPIL